MGLEFGPDDMNRDSNRNLHRNQRTPRLNLSDFYFELPDFLYRRVRGCLSTARHGASPRVRPSPSLSIITGASELNSFLIRVWFRISCLAS